jgi:hypothetical protein
MLLRRCSPTLSSISRLQTSYPLALIPRHTRSGSPASFHHEVRDWYTCCLRHPCRGLYVMQCNVSVEQRRHRLLDLTLASSPIQLQHMFNSLYTRFSVQREWQTPCSRHISSTGQLINTEGVISCLSLSNSVANSLLYRRCLEHPKLCTYGLLG